MVPNDAGAFGSSNKFCINEIANTMQNFRACFFINCQTNRLSFGMSSYCRFCRVYVTDVSTSAGLLAAPLAWLQARLLVCTTCRLQGTLQHCHSAADLPAMCANIGATFVQQSLQMYFNA